MNFWDKYKKIIFIIVFLSLTIAFGYLLFSVFFKPLIPDSKQNPSDRATSSFSTGFPQADQGTKQNSDTSDPTSLSQSKLPFSKLSEKALGGITKTTKLDNSPVISPTLSSNGNGLQYYDQADGRFYSIDENGNKITLSEKIFHNVQDITWSGDKNKAILEYPDGANIVFNFNKNEQVTLPSHWKDFDFSPDSEKIISKSIGLDPDNRWLLISDTQGTQVRPIESLGKNESTVYSSWSPNNQIIAMYSKGVDFNRQEIFFIGLNDENFKSTIVEGRGFQPKWSPNGNKLLYSVYSSNNDMKPNLWVVNSSGDSIGSARKNLRVETWANKCTYSSDTEIFCAVPKNLPEGAGIFEELAKTTVDSLYKINTLTGQKQLMAIPDQNFNMTNLSVTENGKNLFFTDETTQTLHKIELK